MNWRIDVAVQTPAHSALGDVLSYISGAPVTPGALVRVPLGRREVLGVAWAVYQEVAQAAPAELKPIGAVLEALAPLDDAWRNLVAFAARYYQRSLGEIALAALPPQLRDLSAVQLARRLKRKSAGGEPARIPSSRVTLSVEQADALTRFEAEAGPFLLFGSTGSGKTEVYLRAVAALLAREPNPSEARIRSELSGNLCRCGTHVEIVAAVQRAALLLAGGADS